MYNGTLPTTGGIGLMGLGAIFWYPMVGIAMITIGLALFGIARLTYARSME